MIKKDTKKKYYKALLDKNLEFEGVFFVGVKTTGVFCRPTCPARKPKFENCEWFENAQQALIASYRPCKRCRPLSLPHQATKIVRTLVEAVEKNPERRWQEKDFKALCVDSSTVRRQFKKRFGMTFVQYARARRMGIAMKEIRDGELVIEVQHNAGYNSSSGFRDAFSKIMGAPPSYIDGHHNILYAAWLDTKLGPMIAVSDDKTLHLLEFVTRRGLEREIERLRTKMRSAIIPGKTDIILTVHNELLAYFDGRLKQFETPIYLSGSAFQKTVWNALQKIPYGKTISYKQLAEAIGNPKACRAVANANGANQLAIIIPCHRVINSDGKLGGYGGGINRKQLLLDLERAACNE